MTFTKKLKTKFKNINQFFPYFSVQCARFQGTESIEILDDQTFTVSPLKAIERIEKFIKKWAIRGFEIEGMYRKDRWNVPMIALRELIVNAFAHADYSIPGVNFKFAIYDDRIQIENPGILMPGLTPESILTEELSKIRNPVIAGVFRMLNLIESWGGGFKRINHELTQYNLPSLKIEEFPDRLKITLFVNILDHRKNIKNDQNDVFGIENDKNDASKLRNDNNGVSVVRNENNGVSVVQNDNIDWLRLILSNEEGGHRTIDAGLVTLLLYDYFNKGNEYLDAQTLSKIMQRSIRTSQRLLKFFADINILEPVKHSRPKKYLFNQDMFKDFRIVNTLNTD